MKTVFERELLALKLLERASLYESAVRCIGTNVTPHVVINQNRSLFSLFNKNGVCGIPTLFDMQIAVDNPYLFDNVTEATRFASSNCNPCVVISLSEWYVTVAKQLRQLASDWSHSC